MRQVIIVLLFLCVSSAYGTAQPVFTPRNMSLGGGGSTYITDFNANFYNPANLMIQDREGDFSFGIGVSGFYLDGIQNNKGLSDQWENAKQYFQPYSTLNLAISEEDRADILNENYPGNTSLSDNRARYDATLLGMKWKRSDRSFSLAIRTRTSSNIRIGKGWYSTEFEENSDGEMVLDRSLIHRYQSLHEISFGYAESFQFLTNLTPRLDNFIIGIAPKFVMSGSYLNAEWENEYISPSGNNTAQHIESFSYDATGQFGSSTISYMNGSDVNLVNDQSFQNDFTAKGITNDLTSISGIGAGLDIGVTYLLTLGSDLSAIRPDQQLTQKSLRLSFSMTDIGFVSYNDDQTSNSFTDTTNSAAIPTGTSNEAFIGARGQYVNFIEQYAESNPLERASRDLEPFSALLPMAVHGGALLELNRLKLMGDISIGLTNNAFNSTKLISSFGVEIRPLQFLPIRGGIQLEAQRPEFLSIGTAIETRNWDFSVAAQFTPNAFTSQPSITGISVASLQFHF